MGSKNMKGYSLVEICLVICLSTILVFFAQHWILKSYQSTTQKQLSAKNSSGIHRCLQTLNQDFQTHIYQKNSINFLDKTGPSSTLSFNNSLKLTSLKNKKQGELIEKMIEYSLTEDQNSTKNAYLLVRKELEIANSTQSKVIRADVLLANVTKVVCGIDFLRKYPQDNNLQWAPIDPLSNENLTVHTPPLRIKIWIHQLSARNQEVVQAFFLHIPGTHLKKSQQSE